MKCVIHPSRRRCSRYGSVSLGVVVILALVGIGLIAYLTLHSRDQSTPPILKSHAQGTWAEARAAAERSPFGWGVTPAANEPILGKYAGNIGGLQQGNIRVKKSFWMELDGGERIALSNAIGEREPSLVQPWDKLEGYALEDDTRINRIYMPRPKLLWTAEDVAAEASIAEDFERLLWHSGLVQTPPDAKSFSRGEVLGRPVEGDGCLANVDKQKWKALSKNDRRRALKVMGTYAWVYFRVSKVFVTDGAWTLASIERNGRVDEGN